MASGMDEVFGPGDRPKSPDFWKLSSIVLKLDGRLEAAKPKDRQAIFEAAVSDHVDLESISYMAYQRAIRMVPPSLENMRVIQMLCASYIDGFTAGSEFEKDSGGTCPECGGTTSRGCGARWHDSAPDAVTPTDYGATPHGADLYHLDYEDGGGVLPTCHCGWEGIKVPTYDEAAEAYAQHRIGTLPPNDGSER